MKDIFSELYKKVMSFFNNEVKEENSKDTACNRLKLVLMQDRAKMEPALMEKMREEMIEVISKYVEIDKEALDLNIEAEGDSFALMLNIPVLRAKTREEVEAQEGIIIKDEDDDIEEDDDDENTESQEEEDNNNDSAEKNDDAENNEDNTNEIKEDTNIDTDKQLQNSPKTVSTATDDKNIQENLKAESSENTIKQPSVKKKIKHQKDDDL